MTRRTRRAADFSQVEATDSKIAEMPPRRFVITVLDGKRLAGELNLPWEEAPSLTTTLARAVARDASRRRCVDIVSARQLRHNLNVSTRVIVQTCLASGITRPEQITVALVNAVQLGLHSGYAPATVESLMSYVTSILRQMGADGDPDVADRLRRAYSLEVAGGVLPSRSPTEPYSRPEMRRILRYLRVEVRSLHARLTTGAETLLDGAADPRLDPASQTHGWRSAKGIAWELARCGPIHLTELQRRSGYHSSTLQRRGIRIKQISRTLYPTEDQLFPMYWLFCALTGIEGRCAANLRFSEIKDGVAVYLKLRGRKSAEVRPLGAHARQLVQQVAEITARARALASEADKDYLWIGQSSFTQTVDRHTFENARARGPMHDGKGEPIQLSAIRLRTTHINAKKREDPRPDPSHTMQVDLTNYTLNKANEPLLALLSERGINAARDAARPTVINPVCANAGGAARALPVLPPASSDTRVGACSNPHGSPFSRSGEICSADPWLCFRCGNCRVGERHLSNQLAWRRWLDEQREYMADVEWDSQWGETYLILTQEILPEFSDSQIAEAEHRAVDIDPTLWMPLRAVIDRAAPRTGVL